MMSTNILFILILVTVWGNISDSASATENGSIRDPQSVSKEWAVRDQEIQNKYLDLFRNQNNEFELTRDKIEKIWKDKIFSDKKVFVHYSDDKHTRIILDYEDGEIRAESIDSKPQEQINKVIVDVIDTKDGQTGFSSALYKEDLSITSSSTPIKDEVAKKTSDLKIISGIIKKSQVIIKMNPDWRRRREELYLPIVTKWANEYRVDTALVMAVLRAESAFNPNARSSVGAIGLMQIMPQYAGREVAGRLGQPELTSTQSLYDPNTNIQLGVYYLKILNEEYFSSVINASSKQSLTIASYNWGPENVKRAMVKRKIKTDSKFSEIEMFLKNYSPNETQEYLKRVLIYYGEYSGQVISHKSNKEVCFEKG